MRRRDLVTLVAGAATIAASVLLVGSALRWTQAVVALLAATAIAPQLLSRRGFSRVPPLLAALGVAIVLTGIQLIPLPGALIEAVQPVGASLRADGAELVDVSPWSALTLDAPGTIRALCFFIILFGAAWTALRFAVSETGRFRIHIGIGATCGAVALIVAIHELVGATSLYGIYKPAQAHPSILGPLLNENHLGGLMAAGAMIATGLAMYRRQRSGLRAMWLVVVAACGVTAVASHSRGATFALIAGALVAGGVLLAQRLFGETQRRRSRGAFVTTSLPIGVVVVCTIVVIVYASAGGVSSQLDRTSLDEASRPTSKMAIWRSTATLIHESPWVGVGRGAFEPAFTHVHPTAASYAFSHVENEYLQAVADWGIPGALALGLAVLWIVVTAFRRWRDGPLAAGALGAITVLGLQNLVDFSFELLGVALPLIAILATMSYMPVRELEGRQHLRARLLRVAMLVGLAVAAVLLVARVTRTVAEDHEMLTQRSTAGMREVRDSIQRHPLDYYGYARAAELLHAADDPKAVQLLNHALRLHPTHPGLHHMAADMLYRAGRLDQAAIEYAAAVHATPRRDAMLAEIVKRFPPALAVRAIPTDFDRLEDILAPLAELAATDVAIGWLARVIDERPGNRPACEHLYALAVSKKDLVAAEKASERCTDMGQDSRLALAQLLLDQKRYADVRKMLGNVEEWTGEVDLKRQAWLVVCDSLSAEQRWDEAKRCLRRLDASGTVTDDHRLEILSRIDRISEALRAQAATAEAGSAAGGGSGAGSGSAQR